MKGSERAVTGLDRYLAFLCYSHRDAAVARKLHRDIESYRVPRRLVGRRTRRGAVPRHPRPIFRDREELQAGGDLAASVRDALARSDLLIVICSPEAARSPWVEREIIEYKRHHDEEWVLAAIIAGEPGASNLPGRADEECFPAALRFRVAPDGTLTDRPTEPIAADLRPIGDGPYMGKLKLIAGLLDVPLDELVQREHGRRQRNMAAVAAASLAGMLVMGVLTYAAIDARDETRVQHARAEGLIEFMLGDLRQKLEPVGRLDALDVVGAKVLDYYAGQQAKHLDADALGRRSRALHLIGEVHNLRGNLDAASRVFRQAAATTAELLAREPDNGQRIFDHAQSVFWVGYVAWQRGEHAAAEAAFNEYSALARRLVSLDPDNHVWRAESGHSAINRGVLLLELRRVDEAARAFNAAAAVFADLMRRDPGNGEWPILFARAKAWLADAERARDRFAAAEQARDQELAIYRSVMARNPSDATALEAALVSDQALAQLAMDRGDLPAALARLDEARRFAGRLTAHDPDNMLWVELSVPLHYQRARIALAADDLETARRSARHAIALSDRLIATDGTVVLWKLNRLVARLIEADVLGRSGEPQQARRIAVDVMAALDRLTAGDADQVRAVGISADAHLLLGRLDDAMRISPTASRDGWAALPPLLEPRRDTLDARGRCLLGRAYAALGRSEAAAPIAEDLSRIGYRHPDCAAFVAAVAAQGQVATRR